MTQKTTDWTLIARYITENASPKERRSVLDWALMDKENQQKLDEVTRIWKHSGRKVYLPIFELDTEWCDLQHRIALHESSNMKTSNEIRCLF